MSRVNASPDIDQIINKTNQKSDCVDNATLEKKQEP